MITKLAAKTQQRTIKYAQLANKLLLCYDVTTGQTCFASLRRPPVTYYETGENRSSYVNSVIDYLDYVPGIGNDIT